MTKCQTLYANWFYEIFLVWEWIQTYFHMYFHTTYAAVVSGKRFVKNRKTKKISLHLEIILLKQFRVLQSYNQPVLLLLFSEKTWQWFFVFSHSVSEFVKSPQCEKFANIIQQCIEQNSILNLNSSAIYL